MTGEASLLSEENVKRWTKVALDNVAREFPHAYLVLLNGPEDSVERPSRRHPSFYGSYDWHSCVEMYWLAARLLRLARSLTPAEEILDLFERQLTPEKLRQETTALPRYERPYGYGWALMLATELELLGAEGSTWREAIEPLAEEIVARLEAWLPTASYPVRIGMHSNSAFGLSLALGYARNHAASLARAIEQKALGWFSSDAGYPVRFEPSGTDFLSPSLCEAELMAKLLSRSELASWLGRFMPELSGGKGARPFEPAVVSDPADGQIAHLHGLNLSRAWCLRRLATTLPPDDERIPAMRRMADGHLAASLPETVGSDYMVEHWLAAYAVLAATEYPDPPGD